MKSNWISELEITDYLQQYGRKNMHFFSIFFSGSRTNSHCLFLMKYFLITRSTLNTMWRVISLCLNSVNNAYAPLPHISLFLDHSHSIHWSVFILYCLCSILRNAILFIQWVISYPLVRSFELWFSLQVKTPWYVHLTNS